MPSYFIVNASITDAALLREYSKGAGPTLAEFGATPLVVTNEATVLEGEAGERVVVLEFPDRDALMAWYNSDAYQAVIGKRFEATKGIALVVDGLG